MKKLFIVVDAQKDFVTGSLGSEIADHKIPRIEKEIENLDKDDALIFTFDTHNEDYLETFEGKRLPVEHCIKGTDGWNLDERLQRHIERANYLIEKPTFGFLEWKNIVDEINPDEIHICGFCTDICVISNALILRAIYPGKKIVCRRPLCAGTTKVAHNAAIKVMLSCQIDVEG